MILLIALAGGLVIAVVGMSEKAGRGSLASTIAFKQRCAVRFPDPCWQDALTEAYGRAVGGAVRALAPAPQTRVGPGGEAIVGVDYRRCRKPGCAVPKPGAESHLTVSGRRTTGFVTVRDLRRRGGVVEIDYWIYRPSLGWELISRSADSARVAELARTPLPDDADPALVPLETLLGRDDARFSAGEEPPWRGRVESHWGR